MSTNPFDDDYDPSLVPVGAKVKNPFDFDDDESPISAAVRREISRQGSSMFYSSFGDSVSESNSMDAAISAVFSTDSTTPLVILTPASKPQTDNKGSGIVRSNTHAHGNSLAPGWTPVRSASAKAALNRRKSSKFYTKMLTTDQDAAAAAATTTTSQPRPGLLFRPISSKSISFRGGALAAGEKPDGSITKSKSSTLIGSTSRETVGEISEEEAIARQKYIVDLIEAKFRKHMEISECEDGFMCQCEKDCPAVATVYTQRYGRVGNQFFVREGFYDPAHLVDSFIDAYDEEKRLKDEEAERIANRDYSSLR